MATNRTKLSIGGDVVGSQIAVGDHNIQVAEHGVLINIVAPPAFTRRPGPVELRPRRYSNLLDRSSEIEAAKSSWTSTPIVLRGIAGIGKTSLLHELAHLPETSQFADGVVFLSVRDEGLDDLRQKLFECFYECNVNAKAEEPQILHSMQTIRALILLDDLTLSNDDTSALLDTAPNCAFILVSTGQVLLGKSQSLALSGLPENESLALFERELGRSLSDEEKSISREICRLLNFHPTNILQFAALAREDGKSLEALKTQLKIKSPEDFLIQGSIESLPEPQQRILALLTAAGGAVIPQTHLAALASSSSAQATLDDLKSRGLVQSDESGYSLSGSLGLTLSRTWKNLDSWEDYMINYFVGWLTQNPKDAFIEQAQDILVATIKKAGAKKRWPAVISLGRGMERVLMLWRRWQSWEDILGLILNATRALRDRKTEAWALHQLGSRAMSLDLADQARGLLNQSMDIRKAIGDQAGLAASKHNLRQLSGKPPTIKPKPPKEANVARRTFNWRAAAVSMILFAVGIVSGSQLFPRVVTEPVNVVVTQIETRIVIATPITNLTESRPPTITPTTPPLDTTPPKIGGISVSPTVVYFSPGGECGSDISTLTVTAAVSDNNKIAKVALLYAYIKFPDQGNDFTPVVSRTLSEPMLLSGNTYRAVFDISRDAPSYIGFANGTLVLIVQAEDEAGNLGISTFEGGVSVGSKCIG